YRAIHLEAAQYGKAVRWEIWGINPIAATGGRRRKPPTYPMQTHNLSFYAVISYCRTTLIKECKSSLLLPEANMQKQDAFALRRPRN
ncbi:hypothetical protein QUF64_04645, partial [Anaerolineales bacterium HSG6]|nr:hypothetical protein [Anaerolineales bacterium HSG6]